MKTRVFASTVEIMAVGNIRDVPGVQFLRIKRSDAMNTPGPDVRERTPRSGTRRCPEIIPVVRFGEGVAVPPVHGSEQG